MLAYATAAGLLARVKGASTMSAFLNRNGVVVKIPKEKPRADRIHALLHQYFSASLSLDTLVELSQQLHTAGDVSNCGGDISALLLF